LGVGLNVAFVVAEVVVGLRAGSLALLSDAGHNLSDVLGLLLAWGAATLAQRRPTPRRTYGWRRSSILAALLNAVLLLVAMGALAWEAIERFQAPAPVGGLSIVVVAAVGIVINGVTAWFFARGRHADLNVRGAYLHMVADAAVSAGVVVSGLVILGTGWAWVDPAVSLVVALVVVVGTWGLLRGALDLALDAVPEGVDVAAVESYLRALPGVTALHDLHVWALSTSETALTAHLVKPDPAGDDALLSEAAHALHHRFGIAHTTLQWERAPVKTCNDGCAPKDSHRRPEDAVGAAAYAFDDARDVV
ncbi:MAG TPA: cation diffusion facilitator family transporter, partial [Rhodothermales bacterium]|nr:cation diffusion facilitator family transporter [Rhodothermales bacterium]